MGRKLDLSGLTDNEAEHVLQVVQRDMRLRKKEEERLSELKQELDEEGSRCLLLSRQSCFNQRCCIRCCSPFTFLLNPKRRCRDCHYNVCKACRVYNKRDRAWLCAACQKTRLLKTQSLEWFYTNVKKRFKRFGSAKVLKTLYRKHLAEHSALSELTEGSAYEESICNEGSVCESDSTFYRQSEEHSMAETLTVALRVAEEAIDEAISKAEFDSASQKKQNEAHYLREHRGELIEELAKTIVQKIISRRKTLAEMRAEYNQEWPLGQNTDHHRPQSTSDQASSSLQQPGLWRSHSAFSLSANDPPGLVQNSSQTLKKEGGGSAVSAWKSVDRLDNAGVSSVLKSPDGNWIALQSAQLSRPSLLTKRKSLVYSALERESGVVSAYEGMDSDNEAKPELDGSWGSVLQEIHRKMTDSNLNLQDARHRIPSAPMGRQDSRNVFSDSEGSRKPNKPLLALFKRKLPAEIRRPSSSSSRRTSIIDVNFNVEQAREEQHSRVGAEPGVGKVRRSRRKRRSKKEQAASTADVDLHRKDNQSDHTSDAVTPDTLTSRATTPELLEREHDITDHGAAQVDDQLPQTTGRVCNFSTEGEELEQEREADDGNDDRQRVASRQAGEDRDEDNEKLWKMETDVDEDETGDERDLELDDKDMKERLYRLVAQSRLTYFSSTDEELNKLCQSEGKWEEDKDEDMEGENEEREEGKPERLTHRLCQLEKEVRATQCSSTEDELDRAAGDEREEEEDEGLVVRVCRLADQVNAAQFSSTEDELDAADRGEEDAINEQTLWKLRAEKTVQAAQLRDLASLVSASQFSSTEDELDRVGKNEGAMEQEVRDGGTASRAGMEELRGDDVERRESFRDLDVKMFDLRDERAERTHESGDERATDSEIRTEDETDVDEPENGNLFMFYDLFENAQTSEEEEEEDDDGTGVEKQICEEKLEDEAEGARDTEEKTVVGAEKMEERAEESEEEINETIVEQENQPEAKWPDEEDGDRQREEKLKESKDGQVKRETAADSYEDDVEFDRIISSMLMMTLDDMQTETSKHEPAKTEKPGRELEDGETDGNVREGDESEFREKADEQGKNPSEETGSGTDAGPQSSGNERPGENLTGQTGGDGARTEERADATCSTRDNGREERRSPSENAETTAAEQAREAQDVGAEQREGERRGVKLQAVAAEEERTNEEPDEKREETKGGADETEQSGSSRLHEGVLSPAETQHGSDVELYRTAEFISTLLEQRYSAASLRSITTEVLKVLNATEDLLQGVEGGDSPRPTTTSLPPDTDPRKLDQQFSRLEENVYMAAGSVYSLEAELSDLEECARGISSSTSDMELSYLEEQVASAAAKVQQSELQICDISARIAALKNAGLNVDTQSRFKTRTIPVMPVTLDSSRQLRRRLPAPPVKEDKKT